MRAHNHMSQAAPCNQATMFDFVKREPGGPSVVYSYLFIIYFL